MVKDFEIKPEKVKAILVPKEINESFINEVKSMLGINVSVTYDNEYNVLYVKSLTNGHSASCVVGPDRYILKHSDESWGVYPKNTFESMYVEKPKGEVTW